MLNMLAMTYGITIMAPIQSSITFVATIKGSSIMTGIMSSSRDTKWHQIDRHFFSYSMGSIDTSLHFYIAYFKTVRDIWLYLVRQSVVKDGLLAASGGFVA